MLLARPLLIYASCNPHLFILLTAGDHTAIKLWQCPTCMTPIYTALRYNGYIKTELALFNQIKIQQEENRQRLTEREKSQIISAMNEETKHGVFSLVGGRWFVCPNNHPYYIGMCLFFFAS